MEISTKKRSYMRLSLKTQFKIEFFITISWCKKMLRISPEYKQGFLIQCKVSEIC